MATGASPEQELWNGSYVVGPIECLFEAILSRILMQSQGAPPILRSPVCLNRIKTVYSTKLLKQLAISPLVYGAYKLYSHVFSAGSEQKTGVKTPLDY